IRRSSRTDRATAARLSASLPSIALYSLGVDSCRPSDIRFRWRADRTERWWYCTWAFVGMAIPPVCWLERRIEVVPGTLRRGVPLLAKQGHVPHVQGDVGFPFMLSRAHLAGDADAVALTDVLDQFGAALAP